MASIKKTTKEVNELPTIQQELNETHELQEITELQEYAESVGLYGKVNKNVDAVYTALASLKDIATNLIHNDKVLRANNVRLTNEVTRLQAEIVKLRKQLAKQKA